MDSLTLACIFFALSIVYSGVEIAFTSFDRIVVESWKRSRRFGARAVEFLIERPERFLTTTLIGNNLSNVAYATLIVVWAKSVGIPEVWVVVGSPLIVLVFAEIFPKVLGHASANLLVRIGAYPLWVSYILFTPVRWLLIPVTRGVGKRRSGERVRRHLRHEIDHVLAEAEAEGALNEKEADLLVRYLNARDIRAREVMTPRTNMIALPSDSTIADAVDLFRECRHDLLPVYDGDLDHVIGCIRSKDLLQPRASIADILTPVSAIPDSKRIITLLEEFKNNDVRLAIVIDEHGGTEGLIGLKDIVGALVGPVSEAGDQLRHTIKRIAPGKFLVTGAVNRDELESETGWRFPEGEFTTLSGWMIDTLGHIPCAGERVELHGVILRALAGTPRRLDACLLSMVAHYPAEESEA